MKPPCDSSRLMTQASRGRTALTSLCLESLVVGRSNPKRLLSFSKKMAVSEV